MLLAGGGFATLGPSDNPQPVNALGAIWGVGAVDSTGSSIAGTLITTDPSSFPQPWGLGFSPPTPVVHALAVSGDATDNLAVYVGGTQNAPAGTMLLLAEGNRKYEQRFGFIFIVCATGKSSEEMLTILNDRLGNERDTEIRTAAEEQRKITGLRLEKLLN